MAVIGEPRRWATSVLAGAATVPDAAMAGDREALRALLKQGADVNAVQGDGVTALHWAATRGDAEMASMLLVAGANHRAATRFGGLPAAARGRRAWLCRRRSGAGEGRRGSERRHRTRDDGPDAGGGGG